MLDVSKFLHKQWWFFYQTETKIHKTIEKNAFKKSFFVQKKPDKFFFLTQKKCEIDKTKLKNSLISFAWFFNTIASVLYIQVQDNEENTHI